MFARGIRISLLLGAVVVALVAFAFASAGDTHTAEAVPAQVDCTFTPPLEQLIAEGGSGNVTCDVSIRGEDHTLSVDFTIDFAARPPISIDGCTLDGEDIHVGPCP